MKLYVNSYLCTFVTRAICLCLLVSAQLSAASDAAFVGPIYSQQTNQNQIKSYREWKSFKIGESEARVKLLKENLFKSRSAAITLREANIGSKTITEAGLNPQIQNIKNSLQKEELQLSLAQDLTITDYFAGYLTKQKSLNTAIKDVSTRLSAEEVAELMTAYANNFFASRPAQAIQIPQADSGQ